MSAAPAPLVSVVTVNRNHLAGLKKTMESVIGQTYADYEYIVVDGASTDGSREAIEARADKIARWVSEPDQGVYDAMNKGVRMARGQYVQFLNSGDWFASADVLERIFARNAPDEDLVYGDALRPDGQGGFQPWRLADTLSVAWFARNNLCHQSAFYKRELFDVLGPYDESYKIAADWEFNVRLLLARRTTRHMNVLVAYYEGNGLSETQPELSVGERAAIFKRLLPDAVHRDYQRLRYLEEECRRLKEFEDWAAQVRERNPLANYAMATYWAWLKFKRVLSRKGGNGP